ncbi:MAG: hypothetical protein OQK56_01500 [Ignavibacteriaceae bacterium]|nr:hypothetical protein [Ignavibacteriaceae bacterium]
MENLTLLVIPIGITLLHFKTLDMYYPYLVNRYSLIKQNNKSLYHIYKGQI